MAESSSLLSRSELFLSLAFYFIEISTGLLHGAFSHLIEVLAKKLDGWVPVEREMCIDRSGCNRFSVIMSLINLFCVNLYNSYAKFVRYKPVWPDINLCVRNVFSVSRVIRRMVLRVPVWILRNLKRHCLKMDLA